MTARMNAAGIPVVTTSSGKGFRTKSARQRALRRALAHGARRRDSAPRGQET